MVERVASKMDFSQPRVIAEYGPGEGVHSREIARRMTPDSHLLLFELDAQLARALERQFAGDRRVHVIHGDAASLPYELKRRGIRFVRLHSLRHSVQHSQDREEARTAAKDVRCA